ncbi:MAG: hypothetical protein IPM54_12945 [Polyangiaceae bacterium]|nr:hypothetical protein [Polyangiaceae bacterium]
MVHSRAGVRGRGRSDRCRYCREEAGTRNRGENHERAARGRGCSRRRRWTRRKSVSWSRPSGWGPHSRFRTDSKGVTTYETYDYPTPGMGKRVDAVGPPHGGVPTPHTVETTRHLNPRDPTKSSIRESRPRPSTPDEVPFRRE